MMQRGPTLARDGGAPTMSRFLTEESSTDAVAISVSLFCIVLSSVIAGAAPALSLPVSTAPVSALAGAAATSALAAAELLRSSSPPGPPQCRSAHSIPAATRASDAGSSAKDSCAVALQSLSFVSASAISAGGSQVAGLLS